MTKIELNDAEVQALTGLLTQILEHVNFGAGVDAWLGNPDDGNLLLDPDDEANEALCNVMAKLGHPEFNVQQTQGTTMRARFMDDVPAMLQDKGFTNIKKVK